MATSRNFRSRSNDSHLSLSRTFRVRSSKQRNARLRLQYELLEPRHLLASDLDPVGFQPLTTSPPSASPSAPFTWFETLSNVQRVPLASLASVDRSLPEGTAGPQPLAIGEWIVQLTDDAASRIRALHQANALFEDTDHSFTIISGLGFEGGLLVRGEGFSKATIEASLRANQSIETFSLNQLIQGQATTPNESDFAAGLLPGLNKINATAAWDESIGSTSTVVGVVDTGIDPTHPDLYLNIWINQGEIPRQFLDDTGNKLVDIDGDGLITFYDLNHATRATTAPYALTVAGFANGPNTEFVRDINNNGRIDADDLLKDAFWTSGTDDDGNGFFDDIFGVNFRAGAGDPFASNNPTDELGHGTHVAGTIGAIGSNNTGVVGVNWQTSLMSLRILDNNNQGDSGAAIRAINYARDIRERLTISSANRVTEGADVKVLNNSWGQPGGYEASLESAIEQLYEANILFVAAAGNGNILGNGVDNDRTPFYPASYDVPNVIAVAAADANDRLATFSNFGKTSVDILAPGVGIRSTVPGGGYQSANGTSMAAPHVAGTAALIWSALPESTVDEIKQAILSTTTAASQPNIVSTNGRLNAHAAINADVFAPAARLIAKQDITTSGGTTTEFTIEYSHRDGIDPTTIGDDDAILTRQWGPSESVVARLLRPIEDSDVTDTTLTATYTVTAPGGTWDTLDYGDYLITTLADKVKTKGNSSGITKRDIGNFSVRITNDTTILGHDPSVIYVTSFNDSLESGSLRSAILAANNAAPSPRVIILETGEYPIQIAPETDTTNVFAAQLQDLAVYAYQEWSGPASGDFDIVGSLTIVGNMNDQTVINGNSIDRVFKVHRNAKLSLERVTIAGGLTRASQPGGGILSVGDLDLTQTIVRENASASESLGFRSMGGGIASLGGTVTLNNTWVDHNTSDFGGGIFFDGGTNASISNSTISDNRGGGIHSNSSNAVSIEASTISGNIGGGGAIFDRNTSNGWSDSVSISANGDYISFNSIASNLVYDDTNGQTDVFVYDVAKRNIQRVSISNTGDQGDGRSDQASISDDGRYVAFRSRSGNLVPNDDATRADVFVFDRQNNTIEMISNGLAGMPANGDSFSPQISGNGRYIAFASNASNLVLDDVNNHGDIFVYDREARSLHRVSTSENGDAANGSSTSPSISFDGSKIAFQSRASNLAPNDTNNLNDVFIYDRAGGSIRRVSTGLNGTEPNGFGAYRTALNHAGTFITFTSDASNLVPGDTNGFEDVFVYDVNQTRIERVSAATEPNGKSYNASISRDGKIVAFSSQASNLIEGDTNSGTDVFVFDRELNRITRANTTDPQSANGRSLNAQISANGLALAFESQEAFLVSPDNNNTYDIFLYDVSNKAVTSPTIHPGPAIVGTQLTVVNTDRAVFSVAGDVELKDSLLHNKTATSSGPSVVLANVLHDPFPGIEKITPLSRLGSFPPVHSLIYGNPAIDAGSSELAGSTDQLGRTRGVPDIGSVEAVDAMVSGRVYVDLNDNQKQDDGEQTLENILVTLRNGSSKALFHINSDGHYNFGSIPPGLATIEVVRPNGFDLSSPSIQRIPRSQGATTDNLSQASISGDGRFVAFASDSSLLIPGDTNGVSDVFVYDRDNDTIELISETGDGLPGNGPSNVPFISSDGRFVSFSSTASNLVPGDTPFRDVFLLDRTTRSMVRVGESSLNYPASLSSDGRYLAFSGRAKLNTTDEGVTDGVLVFDRVSSSYELISRTIDGSPASSNGISNPFISSNGRYVAFSSTASNLVTNDLNDQPDIFVRDIEQGTTELITIGHDGSQISISGFYTPSLSSDGRHVVFASIASNLVPDDTNGVADVFFVDRDTKAIERISRSPDGGDPTANSLTPAISGNGRFISYVYVLSLTRRAVIVYDREHAVVSRVDVSVDGAFANDQSYVPSLSEDGRFLSFKSFSTNLVPNDLLRNVETFIAPNPLLGPERSRNLFAGESVLGFDFGFKPKPGQLSGRLFHDTVPNGVFDAGESLVTGALIYLDLDNNGVFDNGEPSSLSSVDGIFRFEEIGGYRTYQLRLSVPAGFEQTSPLTANGLAWNVFLPAGGAVENLDFAIRQVQSTGQSSASSLRGRLFNDVNSNGIFDIGVDVPIVGSEVFLDASNFGVRDASEPRTVTDAEGKYLFSGLSARNVAVTTVLDDTLVHANPLGSKFALVKQPLFNGVKPFGNSQAIASGDFNNDGFLDVAVALGEANKLSIRLNDGKGGFLADEIDIDLGTAGAGPTSLVVGQFDDDVKLDVALTANFTGNVTILRNFDPVTKSFASTSYVKVGDEPLDIAAGQFGGDAKLDLVVVNKAGNTVQVLTNNGSGVFTAGPAVATGGKNSSSIVAGNFTGDASLDVAVVHASPLTNANPFGGVTLLRGDGAGGLTRAPGYYTVGASPTDAVVGDFNKDDRPDIAVSNFATNSISILLGQADGTLRVQTAILGTASGAFDLTVGDIDNDGDSDVIASNLRDRNISIFRNIGVVGGEVQFEPLENIGLGQFSLAQRMPLVVGNFDNDTSGPNGTGTIDIVTIPQKTDTLHLLKNTLVNGSHRVALTGLNIVTGRDFIIRPAVLPPSFDSIADPRSILEDAAVQSIAINGIKKGREGSDNLVFSAVSSNVALTGQPVVVYADGDAGATLNYTPQPNMSGVAVITVRATESGADGDFGTSDDGVFERSLTVTVLPVNDPPGFTLLGDRNVFQNATLRTVPNFVTGINRGGGDDELGQTLSAFTVTADNSFFTVPPVINAAGTLMFTPSPNKSGPVTVSVMLSDNGGRANGGNNVTTKSFVINVLPVNEAPSFTLSMTSITVPAAAGARTVEVFARNFAPGGGADEAAQQVSDYVVTTNSPGLFAVLPDVSNDGTLTFTPAIDRSGLATVTARVRDDGGRANGGIDLSAPLTFTILVQPAPISYSIAAASASKPEGQSISDLTPFTFTVTRSGLTSGIGTVQFAVTGSGSNPATASDFTNNRLPQGTVTFAAGETTQTLTINVVGDTLVEPNEGFVVTLSNPSDSATIATATAVGVIQNDDTSLAITATDASKPEGHLPTGITPLTFTVTRSGLITGTTTVGYKVTSSSLNPVAGADFQGNVFPTGTVSFAAGETSKLITVPVVGDTLVEADERLVVSLHTPSAGATITTTSALGIIQNDDVAFAIAIASSAAEVAEGQSLTTPTLVPFTVTRTGSLSGTDTVNYTVIASSTNPVTAADFQGGAFPSGTLTFAPGEFRKTLNIPVAGDSLVELHERFIVSLNSPSGQATITRPNALATILDDDTTFVIAATSANKSEARSLSTPFTFTITRSGVTTGTSTIGYTVTGVGSTPATANDFTGNALPSGTLTFGPNVKTQVLTINVAGDAIVETDDAFVVTLHTPSVPSTIKTATANGVIRNDDTSFSIAATSAVKPEGQSGVTPFTFTVTRNGLTNGIATVNYAVTPSSLNPVNANDFMGSLFPSGTLIFGAGVSTQVITLPVVGDTVSEADERFVLSLSASSSPTTITAASALGVIQNDDVGGAGLTGPPLPTGPSSDTSNYDLLLNSSESWQFAGVELVGAEVHHRFRQAEGEAEVSFIAPSTFTNPLNRFDVDGNGSVASLDALRIINALSRRTLVDGLGHFLPLTAATAAQFQYLDVNVDAKLTPLDALQVINALSRQQRQRTPQASSNTLASPPIVFPTTLRAEGESSPQNDQPSIQLASESGSNPSPSTVPSALAPSTPTISSSSTPNRTKLTASLVDDLFSSSAWGTFDDGI